MMVMMNSNIDKIVHPGPCAALSCGAVRYETHPRAAPRGRRIVKRYVWPVGVAGATWECYVVGYVVRLANGNMSGLAER